MRIRATAAYPFVLLVLIAALGWHIHLRIQENARHRAAMDDIDVTHARAEAALAKTRDVLDGGFTFGPSAALQAPSFKFALMNDAMVAKLVWQDSDGGCFVRLIDGGHVAADVRVCTSLLEMMSQRR